MSYLIAAPVADPAVPERTAAEAFGQAGTHIAAFRMTTAAVAVFALVILAL